MKFRRVILESPYSGDVDTNLRYVRACMRDCLLRNEAPFVSHALYTQMGVLDDDIAHERRRGMEAGFAFRDAVDLTVVYVDLGISKGMIEGIMDAQAAGCKVEFRQLPEWL